MRYTDVKEPWDARLVAWMSRGSRNASYDAKTATPRERLASAVFALATSIAIAALDGRGSIRWWYVALLVVLFLVSQVVTRLWERRRQARGSRSA
jgi:hypothetical protein